MLIRRLVAAFLVLASFAVAQGRRGRGAASAVDVTVLKPARVFDGETMHEGWAVLVRGDRIEAAGPTVDAAGAKVVDLPGPTLMPGMVEGHSHILLHAYNETSGTIRWRMKGWRCARRGRSIICARP